MINKNKISRWLLALAFILTGGLAHGDVRNAQLFETSVPNNYDGGVYANEGFFFTFNFLYWQLPAPKYALIGDPDSVGNPAFWYLGYLDDSETYIGISTIRGDQLSTWNSNAFSDIWSVGQKYTFGFMNQHWGWDIQIFTIGGLSSVAGNAIQVAFNDIPGRDGYLEGVYYMENPLTGLPEFIETDGLERLGVSFARAIMKNEIKTWGIEYNVMRRSHATHVGIFEVGLGVRYLKWDEKFEFWGGTADGDATKRLSKTFPGALDNSYWATSGCNNLVGPQLGLRWFRTTGRFSLDIGGKVVAAYNSQEVRQSGHLGSLTPNNPYTSAGPYTPNIPIDGLGVTNCKKTFDVFSPVAELAVNLNFTITRRVNVQLGWSGMYIGNVLRPVGMTDYTFGPSSIMGLHNTGNKQDVFVHGFNAGVMFNR